MTFRCLFFLIAVATGFTIAASSGARAADAPALDSNAVTASYDFDHFDRTFDAWHQVSLAYRRRLALGAVIARLNQAWRFGDSELQAEADAYPGLGEGTYAYLNVGYSRGEIFPRWRYGAEVYRSLPRSFEISLGCRVLRFGSAPITLLTGSLSKYYGNWLLIARPFVTPGDIGTSVSGSLQLRRYFGDDEYFSASVGAGSSPDQRFTTQEIFRLDSRKASIGAYFRLLELYLSPTAAIERQEIRPEVDRLQTTLSLGIEKRF